MDETKYLRQLQKQGLLSELMEKLGIPKSCKMRDYECRRMFGKDPLTDEKYLVVSTWSKDPHYIKDAPLVKTHQYVMNDYMLISGIPDPNQEKLQCLFDYMKEHFHNAYTTDCYVFLSILEKKKLAKLDEKYENDKKAIGAEIDARMRIMSGK